MPLVNKNTKAVERLHEITGCIDELDKSLDAVEFLADSVVEKRDLEHAEDLAAKVRAALSAVRADIGKKGGPSVAKGYPK
ncbi:hypothetical protein HUO13_35610 [Saccharopolyspora erythraea]|uniref:hypothetical protein n=1 Tax=Saccharopolyspora erythraea TaxID=1836 RepID=UPI001BAB155F|nr:hypothetical protein [Saccharopolyspora erythraea]QUH05402.1 hypothetical protein HUO13_35610 [Saccharopolyspora erythraea]